MRKFESEEQAIEWFKNIMDGSVTKYSNVRYAPINDKRKLNSYNNKLMRCKTRWRCDLDVLVAGDSASIGCDVDSMVYRFQGRSRQYKPAVKTQV